MPSTRFSSGDRSAHRFGPLQAAVMLAAAFTAGVHIHLAIEPASTRLRLGFAAAAIGYLGTIAVLYAPVAFLERLRPLARLLLVGVTIATIVGYFVVMGTALDALAIATKADELLLIMLVLADAVASRLGSRSNPAPRLGRSTGDRVMGGVTR